MFNLKEHEAKVRNYNAFAEFAGEERVLAGALSLEITAHSAVLDNFDSKLRPLLFRKPEHENEQVRTDDDLTEVRRPQLGDLKWEEEFPGYELEIHSEYVDPLIFKEVKLAAFKLCPQQGGIVKIIFRAVVHPTPEESGQLDDLIQDVVDISLTPPKAVAREPDLVDQAQQSTADAAAEAIAADERKVA